MKPRKSLRFNRRSTRQHRLQKKTHSVYYFDRSSARLKKEKVPAEKWLKWLYGSLLGNIALESFVKRKGISRVYGRYMDSRRSVNKIDPFINLFDIDMDEYENKVDDYRSFNDFFTRKLKPGKRNVATNENIIISPADGKLIAFDRLIENQNFRIKGYNFSLPEFLNNHRLASEYINGSMIIVRLAPADYHWFHFPFTGIPSISHKIRGGYYSVSPISIHRKTNTFRKNKRQYTIIENRTLGKVIMAEVGATFVGSIHQCYTPNKLYQKGDPKGFFKFGGSSVALIFREGVIKIDDELLKYSRYSYETEVKMGERIAISTNS